MPVRLSIEVTCFGEHDVRITVDDNGVKNTEIHDVGVFAVEALHHIIERSKVSGTCVYMEDTEGNHWPISLSEWYGLQRSSKDVDVRGMA